jgi:MSHA pilin protein MshD
MNGATLLELIVFLVIVGVSLVAFLNIFTSSQTVAVDPLIRVRGLELAQAQMDDILSRKFDENTPVGGVPACNSSGGPACLGISPESGYDDVGDFHNFSDTTRSPGYTINVSVTEAGLELGLASNDQARLIQVSVQTPGTSRAAAADVVSLSAYKVNF